MYLVFLPACTSVHHIHAASKEFRSPERELQMGVSLLWMLEIKLRSSEEKPSALIHWTLSPSSPR